MYGDSTDPTLPGGGDDYIVGGDLGGVIYAGSGDDQVAGGAGADYIQGNDGKDFLGGEDGNDTLLGGAGNDSLFGGGDSDYLDGGTGNDSLEGDSGAGDDTILAGAGNDTIDGGGDNSGIGSSGDHVVFDGHRYQFTVALNADGHLTAIDHNGIAIVSSGANHVTIGGDGTDQLYGIETLNFTQDLYLVSSPPDVYAMGDYSTSLPLGIGIGVVIDDSLSVVSVTETGTSGDDYILAATAIPPGRYRLRRRRHAARRRRQQLDRRRLGRRFHRRHGQRP